jgi:membrane-bound ClpP family serine protease
MLSVDEWAARKAFRVLIAAVGGVLLVFYGAVLIVVAVNLPDSSFGLVLVLVGLAGAFASFRYYRSPRPRLLIVVVVVLMLTIVWLGVTFLFGDVIHQRRLNTTNGMRQERDEFVAECVHVPCRTRT